MTRGRLVTLEGGEGAGKSTVIAALASALRERGIAFRQAREPGGTPAGEAIRAVLLDPSLRGMCAQAELLLMFASRAQLVREVIEPALAAGEWVLCDRFTDASFAYQGGGRGLDPSLIADLERWAAGLRPDLSFLLDVPVDTGLQRARARGGEFDRIESEQQDFFERVRAAYRARAAAEPARWRVIDATQPAADVARAACGALAAWIDARP
jgi:dTMP kinase